MPAERCGGIRWIADITTTSRPRVHVDAFLFVFSVKSQPFPRLIAHTVLVAAAAGRRQEVGGGRSESELLGPIF